MKACWKSFTTLVNSRVVNVQVKVAPALNQPLAVGVTKYVTVITIFFSWNEGYNMLQMILTFTRFIKF